MLEKINLKKEESKDEKSKVAIVGGGPSGISCAYFLAQNNISSTIIEKENFLGGIMMYGIPDFRLDKKVVQDSIDFAISNHNINIRYNTKYINADNKEDLDSKLTYISMQDLKKQGYEYIFISIGKEKSVMLNIDGIEDENVYSAIQVLRLSNEEAKKCFKDCKVVTVGGGNVAMDSSRFVLKDGEAKNSTIIYRRRREDMPASPQEIEDAENEKVDFYYQKNIIKIERYNKDILEKNSGEEIDTSNINYNKDVLLLHLDDGHKVLTNKLILAIGARVNSDYFEKEFFEDDKIKINNDNESILENVFFGGDIINNDQTIAQAIKSGKDAAEKIIARITE